MTSFRATSLVGLTLRLLMVAACALPFATPKKFAILLGMPPPSFSLGGGRIPAAPLTEEDESEREEEVKAREASSRPERRADISRKQSRGNSRLSFKQRPIDLSLFAALRPTAADPFRNGLGTPFRC
jgi:hypothetical protein